MHALQLSCMHFTGEGFTRQAVDPGLAVIGDNVAKDIL